MNENHLYKDMYYTLFAKVADAAELLEKGCKDETIILLKEAELLTEEKFIKYTDKKQAFGK